MLPKGGFIPGKPGVPVDAGDGLSHRGLGDQLGINGQHGGSHLPHQAPHGLQHQAVVVLPMVLEPRLAVVEAVFYQKAEKFRGDRHRVHSLLNDIGFIRYFTTSRRRFANTRRKNRKGAAAAVPCSLNRGCSRGQPPPGPRFAGGLPLVQKPGSRPEPYAASMAISERQGLGVGSSPGISRRQISWFICR